MQQALGPSQSNACRPPGDELRRVSVSADGSRVDVVLSAAVPVVSLIPAIVDVLAAELGHRDQQVALRYQLLLEGGATLDPLKTLAELGIRDGDALILTSSPPAATPPHCDDTAEAVSVSLAAEARPWTRLAARLVSVLAASWLTGVGAALVMRIALTGNNTRRLGCAGGAAVAAFLALTAAVLAYRAFRDSTAGLTLGLAASGFAAIAGLLAVPGSWGAPNALLATAGATMTATLMRVTGCAATAFTALACIGSVEAAAAVVGAVTAVPLQAIGAASAAISLIVVEAAAPMSIMLAGLASHVRREDASPPADADLSAKATTANSWLTTLVAAFSTVAALGAIGAAAGLCSGSGSPALGITFAAVAGSVLLLRARSHRDLARSVPLVVTGTATLSATLVITAVTYPPYMSYAAAASAMLAAAALCLGFISRTPMFSPTGRRSADLFEYFVLALVVPLACWICGLYGAARGMNLS